IPYPLALPISPGSPVTLCFGGEDAAGGKKGAYFRSQADWLSTRWQSKSIRIHCATKIVSHRLSAPNGYAI
ncbi:MAG: hypothetical protein ACKOOI_21860, partial [Pirellula sp.]